MAGITNAAYRRLCREQGAGLYVCEMITSRGIVERDETSLKMLTFDETEDVRSVQLYGTDPVYVGKAAEILCAEYGVAHIDLNFGCPVPKVTRKGGGGALPWKRRLLGEILEHAVRAAEPFDVPVTMKTRMGIDADHLTFLDAGRIAQESGCAAVALHARTVDQAYSGTADWSAIGELVEHVDIPVLGNGDIWEAVRRDRDGRSRPVRPGSSSAAGASVGPGCSATSPPPSPASRSRRSRRSARCRSMMRRHAELLCHHMGEERGCKELRKHVAWYLKGFVAGGELRNSLALVSTPGRARRAALPAGPRRAVPGRRRWAPRAGARAVPGASCSRRAGSRTPTAPAARSPRTCTPAAERAGGAGMGLPRRGQGGGMRPSVIVFDVNETLSDLSPLGARFVEVGASASAAPLWFAVGAARRLRAHGGRGEPSLRRGRPRAPGQPALRGAAEPERRGGRPARDGRLLTARAARRRGQRSGPAARGRVPAGDAQQRRDLGGGPAAHRTATCGSGSTCCSPSRTRVPGSRTPRRMPMQPRRATCRPRRC